MYALVLLVHIVVCVFLIIVVLLQSGKAADLAGAFGGMGSQTAFGPRGSATLLSKATTASAVVFMITSLALSIMATRGSGLGTSVLDTSPQGATPVKTSAPAVPGQPAQSAPAGQQPVQMNLQQPTAPAATPPGQPIQINVKPTPGKNPGEMQIDMKDVKLPPPPGAPPAKKK
ncbi:MAG TPA: preprotein translocase subunit SecG [Bryobacteraceae bacterium]|jgi:preprotein translocase subunit SecG|nr:preprotein translocase subunit SecG [Bryobacteraceae bacterium]